MWQMGRLPDEYMQKLDHLYYQQDRRRQTSEQSVTAAGIL